MEAAAQGARERGGRSIGLLPSAGASSGPANDYIDHAVYTGLGDGRNFLTAGVPDAAIALAGEAGTLSEIGLALKLGTPLVYLGAWQFLNEHGLPLVPYVETPEQAIEQVFAALRISVGGRTNAAVRRPAVPDQSANLLGLEQRVWEWS
jgi:predicted Rossmann-fold nucleotide-binding protein